MHQAFYSNALGTNPGSGSNGHSTGSLSLLATILNTIIQKKLNLVTLSNWSRVYKSHKKCEEHK